MAAYPNECHMSVRLTGDGGISICAHSSEDDAMSGDDPKIVMCMMPDDAYHLITMMLIKLGEVVGQQESVPRTTPSWRRGFRHRS